MGAARRFADSESPAPLRRVCAALSGSGRRRGCDVRILRLQGVRAGCAEGDRRRLTDSRRAGANRPAAGRAGGIAEAREDSGRAGANRQPMRGIGCAGGGRRRMLEGRGRESPGGGARRNYQSKMAKGASKAGFLKAKGRRNSVDLRVVQGRRYKFLMFVKKCHFHVLKFMSAFISLLVDCVRNCIRFFVCDLLYLKNFRGDRLTPPTLTRR